MRCINCEQDDWQNVDEYRMKPSGMCICKNCGFVSYPSKWKSEEEIKKHYRKAYRNPPNAGNFFSGQRKVHFHNTFLQDVFADWKAKGNANPSVYEVGAAYGMALEWFRQAYPGCTVGGTELTTSYRRNAWHEFKINLTEDFDKTKKHDLIMSYKVAEHQLDADKYIAEYANHLNDGGYLYISVPTWFDCAGNFGLPGFDLEYYYDPNHINVWTRGIFESILVKAGFEIIKKDYVIYDSTYLCRKRTFDDPVTYKEDVGQIIDKMKRLKACYVALLDNNAVEAINQYPDCPQAWTVLAESSRKQMFTAGWETVQNFINNMLKACGEKAEVYVCATDLAMRAKKWEQAIKWAEAGLKAKPENPVSLQQLCNIMREIALSSSSDEKKMHYFEQARNVAKHGREVSAQHFKEFTDLIYLYNAQLPTPHEPVP